MSVRDSWYLLPLCHQHNGTTRASLSYSIHTNPALHNDGAIDRYAHWRTFYQERFKYTRATGKSTLIFLVAFPALIGYVAYQSEGLFEFAGKRRGESVTTRG